ncbi:MAG: WecB/TagA/CpsF family glycosyltransferase [Lachnospiraceae bacterium]|nr:WecB/TagA/CpsF family glycosyltransferase [Lachnospiraceae bacterium]
MGTRIRIMDMEVDMLTQENLQTDAVSYLSDEYLKVVHMISLDYIDTHEKNELVKQVLAQADLVLPGEKTILSAHHVEMLETGGMVVDYHSLLGLSELLPLAEKTFYLVLRDKKEANAVYRYLSRHFSRENVAGVYVADGNVAEEALINDINTKLPDIVVLSMDSTEQEEWLENNKGKINAKLCLVIGSILPLIMRDNVHIPTWLKKLHLGGAYRFFARIPYSHFFRKRIFNRKMDDYITKKKLRG